MNELVYNKPSIGAKGHPVPTQLYYKDGERLFVDFINKIQSLFLPFIGKEKICSDCGGNRELVIRMDLDGIITVFDEVCNTTKVQTK